VWHALPHVTSSTHVSAAFHLRFLCVGRTFNQSILAGDQVSVCGGVRTGTEKAEKVFPRVLFWVFFHTVVSHSGFLQKYLSKPRSGF